MEVLQFILVLAFFSMPFIFVSLLLQSFLTLMNSEDYKTSEHSQTFQVELRLEKKIRREETNALSIAALANPVTLPLFFMWPKDEEYAALFEGKVAVAVKRDDFHDLKENETYKLTKTITRSFYKRKWYEKPILFNWFLSPADKMKDEYEETKVKHKINK